MRGHTTLAAGRFGLRPPLRSRYAARAAPSTEAGPPRDEYDRLRATLHRLALDGPPDSSGIDLRAQLRGRVAWVESLNPSRGTKLRRLFDAIDWGRAGSTRPT